MTILKRSMKVKIKSKVKIVSMLRNKVEEKTFKKYKVQKQSRNSKLINNKMDQIRRITHKIHLPKTWSKSYNLRILKIKCLLRALIK
jgi:hypothetical protein